MKTSTEKLLILTKTYPVPSSNYRETSCVAAINSSGELRRLYPIPYRFLKNNQKFKKWQWINASIYESSDRRKESFRINVDTIQLKNIVGTENAWSNRLQWIEKHIYKDFKELEENRINNHISLGLIKPKIVKLIIEKEKSDTWTEKEKTFLCKEGLFDSIEIKSPLPLRKLPFGFYYEYEFPGSSEIYKHKITDWEIGMLFWHCYDSYGKNWEEKFRLKMETEMLTKKMHFLMGTMHVFQHQWLIIGLIYPPDKPQQNSFWKLELSE